MSGIKVPIPVKVRNLEVHAYVRVLLAPLMGEVPCLEAASISLLRRPRLKFRLVPMRMGFLNGIGILMDAITNIIDNVLVDMLLWPRKLVVPMVDIEPIVAKGEESAAAATSPVRKDVPAARPPPPAWVKTLNQLLVPLRILFPAPSGSSFDEPRTTTGMEGPLPSNHLDWLKAGLAEVRGAERSRTCLGMDRPARKRGGKEALGGMPAALAPY